MIKVCIDKTLNGNEPIKYKENKENIMRSANSKPRMAVVRDKLWDPGANIRIRFLNGEPRYNKKYKIMQHDGWIMPI